MVELTHWKSIVIPKRRDTGCIPTGYEWMIRYLDVKDVDFNTFQEDFDFGTDKNSFESISSSIHSRYQHVKIKIETFGKGHGLAKVKTVRKLIEDDIPCLMVLNLVEYQINENVRTQAPNSCNVMPVIRVDDDVVALVYQASQGKNIINEHPISEVVWIHDNLSGGHDIAWIEKS